MMQRAVFPFRNRLAAPLFRPCITPLSYQAYYAARYRPIREFATEAGALGKPQSNLAPEGTVHVDHTKLITEAPKSGFIETTANQGVLFFDNVYPLVTAVFDARYLIVQLDKLSVAERLMQYSIPKDFPFQVHSIIPRIKDGGAFLIFDTPAGMSSKEVQSKISTYLKEQNIRPWFNPFRRSKCFLVQGRPWLEDLYRFPSTRLKVEFEGPELEPDTVFALFRQFGRMADIINQPKDSKEIPKYVYLQFIKIRSATAAKNCIHGLEVPAPGGGVTRLRITYSSTIKTHAIRDWIFNHPRIVIPIVAAILATVAVSVFDPIRAWFVKTHITRSLDVASKAWTWLKRQTSNYLVYHRKRDDDVSGDMSALWEERKGSIEQLQTWLAESSETFIVVQGPRGSGKQELVYDDVLKGWKNKLVIDCEIIHEARGDSGIINALASQVGYRPVFSWLNTINSFLDLAAQGTLGMGAGLSETLDTQFSKILHLTGGVLKSIALQNRRPTDKDFSLNDDEYLEAHPEKRCVIVVDNFLHRADDAGDKIYQHIADWGAALVTSNIAHVIFLTTDSSFSKQLAKSLPDRVFRTILLGDASPEAAKRYVLSHIEPDGTPEEMKVQEESELNASIEELGGRLTDLEFLARRMKSGEMPRQAVNEIIVTAANEILKLYFLSDSSKRKWTKEQAWALVRMLAKDGMVRYNEIFLNDLFKKGGEEALQALEQAEMISIVTSFGRPFAIKPGKPVYKAAFGKLQEDRVLAARMNLDICTEFIKMENANVAKYEEELSLLSQLTSKPAQLQSRIIWLLNKLNKSQAAIEQYEFESNEMKKILTKEY